MIELVDWTQVVACPIRPSGSWGHLMALIGFVLGARMLARRRPASSARQA